MARHRDRTPPGNKYPALGLAVAVISAALAAFAWQYPIEPARRVPESGRLTASPSPSLSPSANRDDKLTVVAPDEGVVGVNPIVKVAGHAPAGYLYAVLIQARGSKWYVTPCTPDAGAETSTCGGARFGTSEEKPGTWDMVAVLLTARQAQELLRVPVFHGDINKLTAEDRSEPYSYWR